MPSSQQKGRKAWSLWQPRHLPPAGTYQQQKNSTPGKFAYIAQSEQVNIIALKFQTTRSLFRRRRRRGILNSTQPQNGQSVQFCWLRSRSCITWSIFARRPCSPLHLTIPFLKWKQLTLCKKFQTGRELAELTFAKTPGTVTSHREGRGGGWGSTCTIPEAIAGHISAPVFLSFLNFQLINI